MGTSNPGGFPSVADRCEDDDARCKEQDDEEPGVITRAVDEPFAFDGHV